MRNTALLVQLLQEDRARLMSRLDWLLKRAEDHLINNGDRALFEQAFLLELERYTDIEDQIAWLTTRVPSAMRITQKGEETC